MSAHAFSAGTKVVCQRVLAGDALRPGQVYELEALLGVGCFGEVWRCRDQAQGCNHAVKLLHEDHLHRAQGEVHNLQRAVEVALPSHVPELFGMAEADVLDILGNWRGSTLAISTQLIDGGSVSQLIARRARPQEYPAIAVLQDVATALSRLHAAGIVHCDVKAASVLVDRGGSCFLCDFGIAVFLRDYDDGRDMPQHGTAAYMAPEVISARPCERTRYDEKIDIWSLGILGYELALGRTPWVGPDGRQPRNEQIIDELRMTHGIDLSEIRFTTAYEHLLEYCLTIVPEHRCPAQMLLDRGCLDLPTPALDRSELVASFL